MIRFKCSYCHQRLAVPESHAGKRGRCPKCKTVVVIPQLNKTTPEPKLDVPDAAGADLQLLDIPKVEKGKEPSSQAGSGPEDLPETASVGAEADLADKVEHPPQRKLPWVLDIFLYPISIPGLVTLGVIILLPLLVDLTAGLLGPFAIMIGVPWLIIRVVIGWYYIWYVAECVRDSARGGIRAPETLGSAPGIGDMVLQSLNLAACYLVFVGPIGVYFYCTKRTDAVLYALSAYAVLFLPMGLLSVVMFDSLYGLNPIVLIGSIFSTFLPYLAMVALLASACYMIIEMGRGLSGEEVLSFLLGLIAMYLVLVAAHILGRFYWRYQDKLNWDV